jgi:plasmid replication initiation protein
MVNKKLKVCKANKVIEAGYRLTLNEQRVVLACIAQVDSKKELLTTDTFELSAKSFATLFSVSEDRAYHALVEVTESLFNRYIVIDNPFPNDPSVTSLKTRWISSIYYKDDSGKITLRFAQDILPYLGELKGQFTSYNIEYIGKMTSIYGIRLYELLMQWKSIGKREVEIIWFKQKLEIEDLYSDMHNLKKRVIDPAIKDINEHSNLTVSWEQRKTGRRVTHLIFTFSEKESDKPKALPREQTILGVKKSEIEKLAKVGESYEDAALRIKKEKAAKARGNKA